MYFFKLAAIAGIFVAMSWAPIAEAGVKDKDFVKMSVVEQTDVTRTDYFKRLRLMGASEQLAKQLS